MHNVDGIVVKDEVFFTKNDRQFVVNRNGLFEIVGVNEDYLYIDLGNPDD